MTEINKLTPCISGTEGNGFLNGMKKKIKKTLVAWMIFAVNSSFASTLTPYVGGSIGIGGYHSQTGVTGALFGGMGSTFGYDQKLYLGGELNISMGHFNNYGNVYGVAISALPGIMLSQETMLYGRLGLDTMYGRSSHYYPNGFNFGPQYGAGVQTSLGQHWALRAEYVNSNVRDTGQYSVGLLYKFD